MKKEKAMRQYGAPDSYKYGLKITSSFAEEFSRVVAGGGETIYIAPGTRKTFTNDLSHPRLIIVSVEEGGIFEYEERAEGEARVKSDIHVFLRGAGARASITARYSLSGDSRLDILHKIYHEADETVSHINSRGILGGSSHLIYRGGIDMGKGLKNLGGREEAKFLVMSENAKVDAIPALEIASREVRSSHALSISRITEEALFYPKLRGIAEGEARELIASGFLK